MRRLGLVRMFSLIGLLQSVFTYCVFAEYETIRGERLDPSTYGDSVVESMEAVIARDMAAIDPAPVNPKARNDRQGIWVVPNRRGTYFPRGEHNAVNKWGDTEMGIGFLDVVDVRGAYFSGQAGRGAWTSGIQVVGYLGGAEVQRTDWFSGIGETPKWFDINLDGVDRIVIVAQPVLNGAGWYGMDDLTFAPHIEDGKRPANPIVITFEELSFNATLTGSGYAGLIWEEGTGEFDEGEGVHQPQVPPDYEPIRSEDEGVAPGDRMDGGTPPVLEYSFQGVIRGDAGQWTYPPDTDGAVGPDHYVITVNRNFAVYDKDTGNQVTNVSLGSFLPGSNGDPRVLYDQHSGRFVVIVSDFSSRTYIAMSLTSDPMGNWFKSSFVVSQGSDAGKWPDYPTLGVDQHGIYSACYMVGGSSRMSIFAIDKAPLLNNPPNLGTITAFRELPWEGAIQPAHTYGSPAGEYFASLNGSSNVRLRRINPPLSSPSLTELGNASVPSFTEPPDAAALGSSTPLDTVGTRLMMSVYRDGFLYTSHTVGVGGRAACRWYKIDPVPRTLVDSGTISDPARHYFFPSIMVNRFGDLAMGFTGSSPSEYASAYFTGRRAGDPAGQMAPPILYRAGAGPQNNLDGYGRNRWGDYSYTTLDPVDEIRLWTIQEYGHSNDIWGTYVGVLKSDDCNGNGISDECDVDCGSPGGACDVPGCGLLDDCNGNLIPDECEADCNGNGVADSCDIDGGSSDDCNGNIIPDECETQSDCNNNQVQDICDIAAGTSEDCNSNQIPDECETDCNDNDVPDSCDIAAGTSEDCNGNSRPDECDLAGGLAEDCNENGVPDECDIDSGFSDDANYNQIPDECEPNRVIYVDDNGPGDPAPGNPSTGDPDEDGTPEHPFDAIQEAINVCVNGDIVEVADGVYRGNGNREINFNGRRIVLRSANGPENSRIDCQNGYRAFTFNSDETANSIVEGLTIENGNAANGGGVRCDGAGPAFHGCLIRNCQASLSGGGFYVTGNGNPVIDGCWFVNNSAASQGGGLFVGFASATVRNSIFTDNYSASSGAGAYVFGGDMLIRHSTFVANNTTARGGGLAVYSDGDAVVSNSIFWGNTAGYGSQMAVSNSTSRLTVDWCDVEGGQGGVYVSSGTLIWGSDNLTDDPLLGADYHLSSGSPCVDRGDPFFVPDDGETDIDGQERVFDGRVDVGADEYQQPSCVWDLDGNGVVNPTDSGLVMALFGCPVGAGDPQCDQADIDGNGQVNPTDSGLVMSNFGVCP